MAANKKLLVLPGDGIGPEVVREVLRVDEVRGVLHHYHGRRYAGTRRTLRLARGVER